NEVHVAQFVGHPPLPSKVKLGAIGRRHVEARDLVAGDMGEGGEGRLQHLLDVERAADRRGDGMENIEIRRGVGSQEVGTAGSTELLACGVIALASGTLHHKTSLPPERAKRRLAPRAVGGQEETGRCEFWTGPPANRAAQQANARRFTIRSLQRRYGDRAVLVLCRPDDERARPSCPSG